MHGAISRVGIRMGCAHCRCHPQRRPSSAAGRLVRLPGGLRSHSSAAALSSGWMDAIGVTCSQRVSFHLILMHSPISRGWAPRLRSSVEPDRDGARIMCPSIIKQFAEVLDQIGCARRGALDLTT
jgi:hypothetical protein